mgnify:CR=1
IKAGLDKADRTITTVANMQAKPSPAAELKDEDQPGYVLTDMAGPFPRCSVGPFRGARYYILLLCRPQRWRPVTSARGGVLRHAGCPQLTPVAWNRDSNPVPS